MGVGVVGVGKRLDCGGGQSFFMGGQGRASAMWVSRGRRV